MVCTTYDDAVSYDAAILYDGECVVPPVPPVGNYRGGGTIINFRVDLDEIRRKREDEEILIL